MNIQQILKEASYCLLGKWPHRYKAFNLNLKANSTLKTFLNSSGFFRFFSSNKARELVYYHQIICFFFSGGIHALKRGMTAPSDTYECHHINGNTLDNRPSNLIVIPKLLHSQVTYIQRSLCKYIKVFSKSNGTPKN